MIKYPNATSFSPRFWASVRLLTALQVLQLQPPCPYDQLPRGAALNSFHSFKRERERESSEQWQQMTQPAAGRSIEVLKSRTPGETSRELCELSFVGAVSCED